jgi:hypothetical protein
MLPRGGRAWYCLLAVLALYVGSYVALSRIGFRHADAMGAKGFYYVTPIGPWTQKTNSALCILYYPISAIDYLVGTGRPAASAGDTLTR